MRRSFLPVGQGAFYFEKFMDDNGNTINVVYDCGSSTSIHIVEEVIRKMFTSGETIDALFISHFDADHINGIPYLMHYCRVEKIFYPLITGSGRSVMDIYFDIGGGGFTADFYRNPRAALESLDLDYTPGLFAIAEEDNQERTDDSELIRSGEDVSGIIGSGLLVGVVGKKWVFVPHNFRNTARVAVLYANLAARFGRDIDETELDRLWRAHNRADVDNIIDAYKAVPGGPNTNSMALYSGYETDRGSQRITRWCIVAPCAFLRRCKDTAAGCLYTGDYDASCVTKWDEMVRRYTNYWEYIGCVQVPHHGSKYSFNVGLLDFDAYFIISAGVSNRFRHPHAEVVRNIMNAMKPLFLVTEIENSVVCFEVD